MLRRAHADGLAVLGVALDVGNEHALAKLLDDNAVDYPTALITEASLKAAGRDLGGLPLTVIAVEHAPRAVLRGKVSEAQLRAVLKAGADTTQE